MGVVEDFAWPMNFLPRCFGLAAAPWAKKKGKKKLLGE
jgi:hypothetical protein